MPFAVEVSFCLIVGSKVQRLIMSGIGVPSETARRKASRSGCGWTGRTSDGLPATTFSSELGPDNKAEDTRFTASAPLAVFSRTADTPPSTGTSGCCRETPQKSPSVTSLPHLRLKGHPRQDDLREAFLRNARMYQSSPKGVERTRADPLSSSDAHSYTTE